MFLAMSDECQTTLFPMFSKYNSITPSNNTANANEATPPLNATSPTATNTSPSDSSSTPLHQTTNNGESPLCSPGVFCVDDRHPNAEEEDYFGLGEEFTDDNGAKEMMKKNHSTGQRFTSIVEKILKAAKEIASHTNQQLIEVTAELEADDDEAIDEDNVSDVPADPSLEVDVVHDTNADTIVDLSCGDDKVFTDGRREDSTAIHINKNLSSHSARRGILNFLTCAGVPMYWLCVRMGWLMRNVHTMYEYMDANERSSMVGVVRIKPLVIMVVVVRPPYSASARTVSS
jgi:hypothetical protein